MKADKAPKLKQAVKKQYGTLKHAAKQIGLNVNTLGGIIKKGTAGKYSVSVLQDAGLPVGEISVHNQHLQETDDGICMTSKQIDDLAEQIFQRQSRHLKPPQKTIDGYPVVVESKAEAMKRKAFGV